MSPLFISHLAIVVGLRLTRLLPVRSENSPLALQPKSTSNMMSPAGDPPQAKERAKPIAFAPVSAPAKPKATTPSPNGMRGVRGVGETTARLKKAAAEDSPGTAMEKLVVENRSLSRR